MGTKIPPERARLPRALLVLSFIAALSAAAAARADSAPDQAATGDLKRLSVEDLMDVQVTSVSKQSEPVNSAAAAIYVITHEDIVRSGATSVPEILRLAPNLHVVQLSPSSYTITARGFSGNSADQNFSDKLLVLIDGRSVYSPLFSGVYWDAQDTMLEDIDRIEVISGPGATLWGANAVNGVINIITRSSADTQGLVVSAGGGSLEKDASAQLGGRIGEDATLRVYAKGFEHNAFEAAADGPSADDSWSKAQAGFRSDWKHGVDQLTVQGDVYRGNESALGGIDTSLSGANLVTHWQRALSDTSTLQVLGYYDQSERFSIGTLGAVLNTYDLELQHSFLLGQVNEIVWGAGERINRYDITNVSIFQFVPAARTLKLADVFAQDSIALTRDVKLTVGIKLEDDPYSGSTPLPSARLSWKITDNAMLWSAVSRAIRSPTPFDRDVREYLGGQLFLEGGPDFQPEKLTAYELGYRAQLSRTLSISVSTFYNVYDDLRSLELSPTLLPLQWGNKMKGDTFGVELWGNYQVLDWWRLAFGFNQQYENLSFQPGSSQLLGIEQAGDDPGHQASLRSSMTLAPGWSLDADLRYVGSLPQPAVPAYEELNAHITWQISSHLQAALSGFNLLHAHHVEFTVPPSDAISRSVFVSARLKL